MLLGLPALVALALWRLDRTALWVDEVFSLAATNKLGLSVRTTKGTMSLYYLVLWLWAQVSTATWWLRAFSTIGAAVAVALLAPLARRTVPARSAVLAPLLVVAIPIFAWTAVEARSYAWETALTAGCWLLLLQTIEEAGTTTAARRRGWALGLLGVLGPFLHGLFIIQLPGMFLVVWASGRAHRPALLRRVAPGGLGALAVTVAMTAAGGAEMGSTWGTDWSVMLETTWRWFLAPEGLIALLLGLCLLAGLIRSAREAARCTTPTTRAAALVPLIWFPVSAFMMLIIGRFHGTFAPYYLAPAAPGVALALASGLGSFEHRAARAGSAMDRGRQLAGVVAAGTIVALLVVSAATRPISIVEDWRGAARTVAADTEPGDAIVFVGVPGSRTGTGSTRLGFEAAWREVDHVAVPDVISHRRQLGKPQRTEPYAGTDAIRQAWLAHDRVWVVDYQDLLVDSGLLDDARITAGYCPTTARRFRPDISVSLYVRRPGPCD